MPPTATASNVVATTTVASAAGAAIGGAVGGAVALFLIALVIFFVCRARKAAPSGAAPAADNADNYGAVDLARASASEYDVGNVQMPSSNEYGRVGAEPRYSDPGVLQSGGIQAKQTGVGTEYSAL